MRKYFSTFIPGLGDVVRFALRSQTKDFSEVLFFDGLIIYSSKSTPEEISRLRFLNNSFELLERYTALGKDPMAEMVNIFLQGFSLGNEEMPKTVPSFRAVFSKENDLVSVGTSKLQEVEEKLSSLFKMRVDWANPAVEFWFLYRSEGYGFFGLRVTKHPDYKDVLQKGELRPELADLLCLISEPKPTDVFLDPFAGSGAIPLERARLPYKKIQAYDISSDLVWELRGRSKKLSNFVVDRVDALTMRVLGSNSVDKIVTDPPWGVEIGRGLNIESFYRKMFVEFSRVLKIGGILVLLTAQKDLVEGLVSELAGRFVLLDRYDILVSGKKAGVFKTRREELT